MDAKFLQALKTVIEFAEMYGLNFFKQTFNGVRFHGTFDFRVFLFFLVHEGTEIPRDTIIDEVYLPTRRQEQKGHFRIKEHSIDGYVFRINKVLLEAKSEFRIRNFGSPRNPRGFQLMREGFKKKKEKVTE